MVAIPIVLASIPKDLPAGLVADFAGGTVILVGNAQEAGQTYHEAQDLHYWPFHLCCREESLQNVAFSIRERVCILAERALFYEECARSWRRDQEQEEIHQFAGFKCSRPGFSIGLVSMRDFFYYCEWFVEPEYFLSWSSPGSFVCEILSFDRDQRGKEPLTEA